MPMHACVTTLAELLEAPAATSAHVALGANITPITNFLVPAYQRAYEWDYKKFEQLVGSKGFAAHLEKHNGVAEPYFIGHIVTYRNPALGPTTEVVDGQQRFTSLMIIAAALRDEFFREGNYEMAWEIHDKLIAKEQYFRFQSSAYNSDDEDMMSLIQSLSSGQLRAGGQLVGQGAYRTEPIDLDFDITMNANFIAAHGPNVANITSSNTNGITPPNRLNAINFRLIEGTQLEFDNGAIATIQGPIPGEVAVQYADPGAAPPLLIISNVDIPAGATARVSLTTNGMQITDRTRDELWGGGAPATRHGEIDGRGRWWTHYKIALETIRESIEAPPAMVGGNVVTLESWRDLLIDHINLTVARSDSNREALDYFRLINDDRFRQSLSLADVWRAEVISKVTTEALENIATIEGGVAPPAADHLGIDGGQGVQAAGPPAVRYLTGMEGYIQHAMQEIRRTLITPRRAGRRRTDKWVLVGKFLEDFCLSCGKRASGTDALEQLEKLAEFIYTDLTTPMGPVLTSAAYIPGVVAPGRAQYNPAGVEDQANAEIRLRWVAYRDMINELSARADIYREIVKPAAGDPFGTRMKNLNRTGHRQYIPLLMVGMLKIRRAAENAAPAVVRPGPGAGAPAIVGWAPYATEEDRLMRMIEYLVARGTILPKPNGNLRGGQLYTEVVRWCAALDQCDDVIGDISNILQLISGSAAAPPIPAVPAVPAVAAVPAAPGVPAVAAVPAVPAVPPVPGPPGPNCPWNRVRMRRWRWQTDDANQPAPLSYIQFQTIFGLCDGLTWEYQGAPAIPAVAAVPAAPGVPAVAAVAAVPAIPAGGIDPVFWTDPNFVYRQGSECRLLLWRIEEHLRAIYGGAGAVGVLDLGPEDDNDVEHILPKTNDTPYWNGVLGGDPPERWLDRLGNKCLYDRAKNIALQNYDFPVKQAQAGNGYNASFDEWYHMTDLIHPKRVTPLLDPAPPIGGPPALPHNNAQTFGGNGIYGANWGPAEIEIRGEWLFGILWDIFNPVP
jgi:hypothetical protein